MNKDCYKCGESQVSELVDLFGYTICNSCKSRMGLFQDKTLKKYIVSFDEAKKNDPSQLSFEEEISRRMIELEKDHISKKIKLLHVQERLNEIKK